VAESATDLKKSAPSTKLQMLKKQLSFGSLGREALSNLIKFLSAAEAKLNSRRRKYLRLSHIQPAAG